MYTGSLFVCHLHQKWLCFQYGGLIGNGKELDLYVIADQPTGHVHGSLFENFGSQTRRHVGFLLPDTFASSRLTVSLEAMLKVCLDKKRSCPCTSVAAILPGVIRIAPPRQV
jgi:hypothetical protein